MLILFLYIWLVHWPSSESIYQRPRRPGFNPRSSHTKDSKRWYLMPPCLTLSIIRYGSRVKWGNPGKRVAPFPKTRCSRYWKKSLRVPLDHSHQVYLLIYDLYVNIWSDWLDIWLNSISNFVGYLTLIFFVYKMSKQIVGMWGYGISTIVGYLMPNPIYCL